jgi:serine/threonine protein phosphatase PrpC
MNFSAQAITDVGLVRSRNEDTYRIDEELGLYLVCDGMGGHAAGEVAAETAAAAALEYVRACMSPLGAVRDATARRLVALEAAKGAVQRASREVCRLSTCAPKFRGMGTTLTMLLTVDDYAISAHVGDSRLYLVRGSQVRLLTSDHTLENELTGGSQLTSGRRLFKHFGHMLTRFVGEGDSVRSDTEVLDVLPRDRLLLCTDGLSKYFDDDKDIVQILSGQSRDAVMANLVEFANVRGGADNITAIVVWAATEAHCHRLGSPLPGPDMAPPRLCDYDIEIAATEAPT